MRWPIHDLKSTPVQNTNLVIVLSQWVQLPLHQGTNRREATCRKESKTSLRTLVTTGAGNSFQRENNGKSKLSEQNGAQPTCGGNHDNHGAEENSVLDQVRRISNQHQDVVELSYPVSLQLAFCSDLLRTLFSLKIHSVFILDSNLFFLW